MRCLSGTEILSHVRIAVPTGPACCPHNPRSVSFSLVLFLFHIILSILVHSLPNYSLGKCVCICVSVCIYTSVEYSNDCRESQVCANHAQHQIIVKGVTVQIMRDNQVDWGSGKNDTSKVEGILWRDKLTCTGDTFIHKTISWNKRYLNDQQNPSHFQSFFFRGLIFILYFFYTKHVFDLFIFFFLYFYYRTVVDYSLLKCTYLMVGWLTGGGRSPRRAVESVREGPAYAFLAQSQSQRMVRFSYYCCKLGKMSVWERERWRKRRLVPDMRTITPRQPCDR